ncbi:MAG: phage integrase SAM-like domain-containing protein [Bacteroidales bacterium]|jgi:hypothetical protein|nr:phage integrase SAM-like domain-containing protein [Bacteroidales bacterium]
MYYYSKDGITVASMLDTRRKNAKEQYPVRIRVNKNRVREYYPTGKNMTREEWENLPNNKTVSAKELRASIENSFYLVRNNVEALAEKGIFSFDTLNLRLAKATGDTVNNALKAKIEQLETEERIGSMLTYKQTLVMLEKYAGGSVSFNTITVSWLKRCELYLLKTVNQTTIGIHFRNLRSIMNDARKAGVIKESDYPFGKDKFEIKTGEAHKKALTIKQISQIFKYSDGNDTTDRYKDLSMVIHISLQWYKLCRPYKIEIFRYHRRRDLFCPPEDRTYK